MSTDTTTSRQETTPAENARPDDDRRRNLITGLVLVIAGLAVLGLQVVEGFGEDIWLLFIGSVFVAAYLYWRSYGLLVPGGIIMGIALAQIGDRSIESIDEINAIGLGLGFVSIYVIDRIYTGSSHFWPLIPGGILMVIGIASIDEAVALLWPILLIVGGIALVFRAARR